MVSDLPLCLPSSLARIGSPLSSKTATSLERLRTSSGIPTLPVNITTYVFAHARPSQVSDKQPGSKHKIL